MIKGVSLISRMTIGIVAMPKAKATGTRIRISNKNPPTRMAQATPVETIMTRFP